jgi:hypothetical protein
MYAHLGRDPHPARLMQQRSVRVYRWVERMNRADQDAPEYFDAGVDFLPDDEVPDSLLAVLQCLAEDFVPETQAAAKTLNDWLSENAPEPGMAAERMLGQYVFSVRGQSITSIAQPYRFFMLQRVHSLYDAMQAEDQASVRAMLSRCAMSQLLDIRLNRQVAQVDNLEVWA